MNRTPEYHAYMASREWALLREKVKARGEGQCERCGLLPHHAVHHLTYERLGHEDLADLQGICKVCHRFESAKGDFDPKAWGIEVVQLGARYRHAGYNDKEMHDRLMFLGREFSRHTYGLVSDEDRQTSIYLLCDVFYEAWGRPECLSDPRFLVSLSSLDEQLKLGGAPKRSDLNAVG